MSYQHISYNIQAEDQEDNILTNYCVIELIYLYVNFIKLLWQVGTLYMKTEEFIRVYILAPRIL